MKNITVDSGLCTRCGICVEVCPRGTMRQDDKGGLPYALAEGPCTVCGHCEAHCPPGAITVSDDLPRAPDFDPRSAMLSAEQLSHYLCSRRSVRAYASKPVEQNKIEALMDTVRYAPTGINRQLIRWVIVHRPGEVHRYAGLAVDWLRRQIAENPEFAARYQPILQAWDAGHDAVCRGAPHLAIAISPKDYGLAHTDTVIAASYFEVAAPAFGIGTCWAGYMDMAFNNDPVLQRELGYNAEQETLSALLFGYPAHAILRLPRRKPAAVLWR